MCQSTNNPAETTRLLNEIDSAFAGIDHLAKEIDYTEVIYIEEIGQWMLREPAIELPCDEREDEARRRDAAVYGAMRQECSDPY